MALTKDWGDKFARLQDHIGAKAKAGQASQKALEDEVARHDGSHGFGRHGYQTGWESQLLRSVTGITPDQSFDPRGLQPSIRSWGYDDASGTVNTYDLSGTPVSEYAGFTIDPSYGPSGKAQAAGGFLSPEAHQKAINNCKSLLGEINNYPVAKYAHSGGKKIMVPITSVEVVVSSSRAGDPYGIGFKPVSKTSVHRRSYEEVASLILGFQMRKTWEQIYPGRTAAINKFHVKNERAFKNLQDLFDYLGVEPMWQTSAMGIFRRPYMPPGTMGPWRMVTIFPCQDPPHWSPSLFLDDAKKRALTAARYPIRGYKWTGQVFSMDKRMNKQYPA